MTLSFLDRFRPRRTEAPAPVFDGLAQLRAYWEGLRPAGGLPARADLDPRGLTGVLDRVFLAERIGRGLAQVRIAGSGLADFAGMDLRGLPLSCIFAPESRPLLAQALENVFSGSTLVEADLGSDRGTIGGIVARLVLLPLADEAGGKLSLGALSFADGKATRCKFQVLARRETALEMVPAPAAGAPMQDARPVQPIRRFGHLSLVHTSD